MYVVGALSWDLFYPVNKKRVGGGDFMDFEMSIFMRSFQIKAITRLSLLSYTLVYLYIGKGDA
jgi:hypothetical protein